MVEIPDQRKLHEPIKRWLELNGVKVLPESEKFPVAIKDVLPTQNYIFPDIIGVRETGDVVVVEVETDPDKILEVMGKCMLWKTAATYVYVAYPKEKCHKFKVLEKFGIGLLSVSEDGVDEVIKMLPAERSSYDSFKATELHPVDHEKQSELYKQIKRIIAA
jgi:hypothetical protein